jgi:nicotinamide-nucleotide amidase
MIASEVVQMLKTSGMTVGLAESCTGGLIAGALTSVPGSSACFGMGVVTYSNDAKNRLLQVPTGILEEWGAVSPETGLAMAQGIRNLSGADLGLAVTGIAGPDGGTKDKPVGLVYIAIAGKNRSLCCRHLFPGNRDEVRKATVDSALGLIMEFGVNG